MNTTLKNILAVIAGVIIGGALNMLIIMVSSFIIPPPEGAVLTTMEGLKASMHLMQPKHFLLPFLAHALGTLLGAYITASIVVNHKRNYAIGIGCWFLIGGAINIIMLPSPIWFTVLDLVVAYIPMALLAAKFATKKQAEN